MSLLRQSVSFVFLTMCCSDDTHAAQATTKTGDWVRIHFEVNMAELGTPSMANNRRCGVMGVGSHDPFVIGSWFRR